MFYRGLSCEVRLRRVDMAVLGVIVYCLTLVVYDASCSFFDVPYPSVIISAETGGNVSVEAGNTTGNIYLYPGKGGTVMLGDTDILKLIEIIDSLPPVWDERSPHGSLGTFLGGDTINITVQAIDPEGGVMTYRKVSGAFPPGLTLNSLTGKISGKSPDVDATYEFGIRVTDAHGKFADQQFTIDTREKNQCKSNPCIHSGVCSDRIDAYHCSCPSGYSGSRCEIVCADHALGVDVHSKQIPDAQMSAYLTYGDHHAYEGRLQSASGWIGQSTSAWLQVDLGRSVEVHRVAVQGYPSASYSIKTFHLEYSSDGNSFHNVIDLHGHAKVFNGSDNVNSIVKTSLPSPLRARFFRFRPLTFGSRPGLRVELYGCA